MSKRLILLLLGVAISVVSLYLAFQGFDLEDVWAAMLRVRLELLALAVIPYAVTFMTKVWRWRTMFYPDQERARTGTLFTALMISYIPLPFRAGEVARGVIAGTRTGIPIPRVFSTIVVEKVLDVLTLLLFLGISLPFVGLPRELQGPALLMAAGVLAVSVVLAALVFRPEWGRSISRFVSERLPVRFRPPLEHVTEQVLRGITPLSTPHVAARLGLWSIATWGINSVTVYLMLWSFNLQLTPFAAVVLVVVTNLSMAIPSAPGYVGPFELAVVAVLGVLGVIERDAQAFAIFYHFVGLAPVAILGLLAVVFQGVGMAVFRGGAAEDATTSAQAAPPATAEELAVVPSREREGAPR